VLQGKMSNTGRQNLIAVKGLGDLSQVLTAEDINKKTNFFLVRPANEPMAKFVHDFMIDPAANSGQFLSHLLSEANKQFFYDKVILWTNDIPCCFMAYLRGVPFVLRSLRAGQDDLNFCTHNDGTSAKRVTNVTRLKALLISMYGSKPPVGYDSLIALFNGIITGNSDWIHYMSIFDAMHDFAKLETPSMYGVARQSVKIILLSAFVGNGPITAFINTFVDRNTCKNAEKLLNECMRSSGASVYAYPNRSRAQIETDFRAYEKTLGLSQSGRPMKLGVILDAGGISDQWLKDVSVMTPAKVYDPATTAGP
jgi:hypothetical protein